MCSVPIETISAFSARLWAPVTAATISQKQPTMWINSIQQTIPSRQRPRAGESWVIVTGFGQTISAKSCGLLGMNFLQNGILSSARKWQQTRSLTITGLLLSVRFLSMALTEITWNNCFGQAWRSILIYQALLYHCDGSSMSHNLCVQSPNAKLVARKLIFDWL